MGFLRLVLRAALAIATVLLITCLMSLTSWLKARRATRAVMQGAFRLNAAAWGIRIHTQGALTAERPLIVVSNHFTYLDLFVLGSLMPAAFTPKVEIRAWPVLGYMSKVSGCLFIDRRRSQTLENTHLLNEALASGDIISLFPEGTTSDGTGLLPFKSSLFGLAVENGACIQPVTLRYTALNGHPVTKADLPVIGWYGDSYFFPHVVQFLRQRSLDATIIFHAPVRADRFASRKDLAKYCREVIGGGLHDAA